MTKNLPDTKVWDAIKRKLQAIEAPHVRVGVLSSKGGGEAVEAGFTLVELATVHEFGSPANGIPERSFIRRTMADKQPEIAAVQAKLAGQLVTNPEMRLERALGILGAFVAAEVKKTITVGRLLEANSPSTIAQKGSDRPLVDTGRLVQSITYEVVA